MVLVTVSEGVLGGSVEDNTYGGTFCSFKGIPYAQPPLGDLRFKAPQPPKPWQGVRSAKEHGPVSMQFDLMRLNLSLDPLVGSEDCLYLNVYTPDVNPVRALPVMVWIHGGAFLNGSGNDDMYGPEFLTNQGVILVTLNYRVEALGFLCLDTEEISGNAGMKDQVAALRWVKKNISKFGGDPDNITIFGESAGGASVGFQLISPMSKGLFNRAIAQSGAATSIWATPLAPREVALTLARLLGCYSEDDKELYNFFKDVPAEKLVKLELPLVKESGLFSLSFGIVSEKQFGNNERFFYGDTNEVIPQNVHEDVEIMTGYTRDEGLLGFIEGIEAKVTEMNKYTDFFVPKAIKYEYPIKTHLEISKKVKEYFIGKGPVTAEKFDLILRYSNLEMFMYDVVHFAKLCSLKNKVYLYKFTCVSERNVVAYLFGMGKVLGDKKVVCHGDELTYLFPMKRANLPLEKGSETEKLIQRMCTLWTNFAKFGNPTPDGSFGFIWEPLKHPGKAFLEIGNEVAMKTNPEGEDMAFFESIYKEYHPKKFV